MTDLFSRQPYRFHNIGNDLELYSLGPDGKDHTAPAEGELPNGDDGTVILRAKPQSALPVPVE